MRSSRNKCRILLVEGEADQRWLAGQLVSLATEFELLMASDGLEGLEMALTEEPQAILVEMVLPGLSGLELLRRYRVEGGKAPVMVVTVGGEEVEAEAKALGADFVFPKPVAWGDVLRRVKFRVGGLTGLSLDILEEMGAPDKWAGFHQSARCAALLGEGRCQQLKAAYIQAGQEEGVGIAQVEINIRRLIAALHAGQSPAYQAFLEKAGLTERPSNSAFLHALAQAARERLLQ